MNSKTFIEKSIKIHSSHFDYSFVDYVNSKKKIKIICKIHNILFEQQPYLHLQNGCPICRIAYKDNFIKNSNKIHNNKYDYSLINYKNNHSHVDIICKVHGKFTQTPQHHLRGFGCFECSKSKGETIIHNILETLDIKFETQKTFNDCKDKRILPFDFYLNDYNTCIEYDGRHHYEPINYWGGEEKLKYTKKHDKIKNDYCQKNNINLLRIKFNNKNDEIINLIENLTK